MAKHRLSKSTFVRSLQCQKSLYLHAKRPFLRDRISVEQLAKFRRGTDVGLLAREMFPGGIDLSPKSPSALEAQRRLTLKLLSDKNVSVLYEAVFEHDEVRIMLDILVRNGQGWDAMEVKSSRKLSQTYFHDAALQYYILKSNELNINNFFLIHINEDYVFDGELKLNELFKMVNVSAELERMLPETTLSISRAKETLSLDKSPQISAGAHCHQPYPCDFIGHCWKHIPDANLWQMRSLTPEVVTRHFALQHYRASDIAIDPDFNLINPVELEAFQNGLLSISTHGKEKLRNIKKQHRKVVFLKIISHQPAIPFLPGFKPYQPIPLAVIWFDAHDSRFLTEKNLDSVARTKSIISHLVNDYSLLITDDLVNLEPYLVHQATEKVIGLRQFVADAGIYHHAFGRDYPFVQIVKALTGIQLTSEHWLQNDLLEASEPQSIEIVLSKAVQYPRAMKQVWEKFLELAK